MVEIDLEDPYIKEQLDNIIEFENTMIKKCGMDMLYYGAVIF